jgi:hypothetical protein
VRRWRCCGRGWWRWRNSRTAAVALLLAAEREFLPSPLSFVSFPFRFLPFLLLPRFSFLLSPSFYLFPLSLLCFFFFVRSPPLLFSSPSVFPPSVFSPLFLSFLFSQRSWPLFIEAKDAVFFTALMGGSRLVGHWARLPRFGGWCAMGGRPLCPVGGLQARVAGKNSKKSNPFSLLPRCVIGGRR